MIYIHRLLWLIGYIPLFILESIMFLLLVFIYPFVGAFYFVITGSAENIPFDSDAPIFWIDMKYKDLLDKIKD